MEAVAIYRMFRETQSLVRFFEKRVRRGKGLTEGLEITRFIYWSGLLQFLRDNAGTAVVKVNAPKLAKRVTLLQEAIQERFKTGKHNDE